MTTRPASEAPAVASRSSMDDVIECFKRDVDRTLLREALRFSPAERLRRLAELQRCTVDLRAAGKKAFG